MATCGTADVEAALPYSGLVRRMAAAGAKAGASGRPV